MQFDNWQDALSTLDGIIRLPNPKTGKMWNDEQALGEVCVMVNELIMLIDTQMYNVPEPVRRSIQLLMMAVGSIATTVRKKELESNGPKTTT